MFNWFGRRDTTSNVIQFPREYPEMPPIQSIPKPKNREPYRVGTTVDGQTTLTVMSDGSSMTLTMNQEACEHLIKMLRASYVDEDDADGS
jgi:hypothetical protein